MLSMLGVRRDPDLGYSQISASDLKLRSQDVENEDVQRASMWLMSGGSAHGFNGS